MNHPPGQQKITWTVNGESFHQEWLTENDSISPKTVLVADDSLKADDFYRKASEGAVFVWLGDYHNAKMILQAVDRRIDKSRKKKLSIDVNQSESFSAAEVFHKYRQSQSHRARLLSRLVVRVGPNYQILSNRAPKSADLALKEVFPDHADNKFVISLRELLGIVGAHEWRKKGVFVPALGNNIYPHFGLFSPSRGEYIDLVNQAPLPSPLNTAFDIGTGTGVLAAILAKRGVRNIIATDLDPRAMTCARENLQKLGFIDIVDLQLTNLFPSGRADLIVCNPPWIPARPTSPVERGVYDENSQMLKGFLTGLIKHLNPEAEAWLIMSDLAEHLGLRESHEMENWIKAAGLQVVGVIDTKAKHDKSVDQDNPLYFARSKEKTRLFRLKKN